MRWWQQARTDEKSSATLYLIITLPLLFAVFGLSFDAMHNVWLRASLNNDLDLAVTSAATQSELAASGSTIGVAFNCTLAQEVAQRVYSEARTRYRVLVNQPSSAAQGTRCRNTSGVTTPRPTTGSAGWQDTGFFPAGCTDQSCRLELLISDFGASDGSVRWKLIERKKSFWAGVLPLLQNREQVIFVESRAVLRLRCAGVAANTVECRNPSN